ncbi:MAG TPA: hypothetical protein VLA21_03025, partial [Candidatus Limnocylindria bacterium]|nr:hypothetical protein [Candidatus Limnocylindria bacterium]
MKPDARKVPLTRLLCLLTALALALPMTGALAEVTHGIVTGDKVLFRKSPTGSDFWDRLDTGWVAKVLEETTVAGVKWFKAEANIPVNRGATFTGYIHGSFFRMMTAQEEADWLVSKPQPFTGAAPTATPAPTPTPTPSAAGSYALVTAAGANLRQEPEGASLTALALNTLVRVLDEPTASVPWYRVEAPAYTGYVHKDHLRVLTPAEKEEWDAQHAVTPTPPPPGTDAAGTLETTLDDVNLRKTPGGLSVWKYPKGRRLQYYGDMVFSGGWYWAYIKDGAREGYLRSDCYTVISGSGNGATPGPTATPQATGAQVRITLGGTNLRQVPGGTVLAILPRGRVLPAYGLPTSSGGYNWVYVYDDASQHFGYVRSDCYEFVGGATPAPTPTPGPVIPPVGTLTLTKGGVNLRATPGGLVIATLESGLGLGYTGFTQAYGYTWSQVLTAFGNGSVR